MSLLNFQSALAYVLRGYDAQTSKTIDDVTRLYELTPDEKASLDHVINQQRLKAYGEELFLARWSIIRDAIVFLQPFLDFGALTQLWEHDFEKKSQQVIHEDLALRFTDYLVNDPKGQAFVSKHTAPFVPDLVKYVNMVFTFSHNYLPTQNVPPHSCLTDRPFAILDLDYDVREFFAELMDLEDPIAQSTSLPTPPQRAVKILFIADDEVCAFRSFEINEELEHFLHSELQSDHAHTQRPSCYNDLVEIGLCRGERTVIKKACCNHDH